MNWSVSDYFCLVSHRVNGEVYNCANYLGCANEREPNYAAFFRYLIITLLDDKTVREGRDRVATFLPT